MARTDFIVKGEAAVLGKIAERYYLVPVAIELSLLGTPNTVSIKTVLIRMLQLI